MPLYSSSIKMTAVLLTLLGLSLQCAVNNEISPCTCQDAYSSYVSCDRMQSFDQVVDVLRGRFAPHDAISLNITNTPLQDFSTRSFQELSFHIKALKMNHDNLSELSDVSFTGLERIGFLSLADNIIGSVPRNVLRSTPKVRTLDLARNRINWITNDDLKMLTMLQTLVVAGNNISWIDKEALPKKLTQVHVGINKLTALNGTLRDLQDLEWLFINDNQLVSIEDEMPLNGQKLMFINGKNNHLEHLPQSFRGLPHLNTLFFTHNKIVSIDRVLQKCRNLKRVHLSFNRIQTLAEDEFFETEKILDLALGYNLLRSLNGSLLPLKSLKSLNLTHNDFKEFSMQELRGLKMLRVVDLSNNRIEKISGKMENLVELETRIYTLHLENNLLTTLDGALMGLNSLTNLNISNNLIDKLSPDDLIGLDNLKVLDVSHNRLTTLEETGKTYLPSLEKLFASYNLLQRLHHDFHGLPSLCFADLTHNSIFTVSYDLVEHTLCKIHSDSSDEQPILKIVLQHNPVLCDEDLHELIVAMERQNARIHGIAQCIVRGPDAPHDHPMSPFILAEESELPKVQTVGGGTVI